MVDAITAAVRTQFGKGAARRLRATGNVPAVLYGHGTEPVHLALPTHEVFLATKGSANALLKVSFEGKSELALVKDIQRDVVTTDYEHIDLLLVRRGEKVTVEVPVTTEGESVSGTIHSVELQTLTVEAEATSIPEHIVVVIDGLEDGTVLRVSDLTLPKGVSTDVDPETAVVVISIPRVEVEEEAAEGEEAAEAADAEPAADED